MAELETARLVERSGLSRGATGRSAAVYRLGNRAGYVLAVDRGSTQVSMRAAGLDGELLDEDRTTQPGSAGAMIAAAYDAGSEAPVACCGRGGVRCGLFLPARATRRRRHGSGMR